VAEIETPWSRARKLRSVLQEERLNTYPGGQKGINSGRFSRWPRDGKIGNFLIEARTNQKPGAKSARIEKQEWLDLKKQALHEPGGMLPAMQIDMDDVRLVVIELAVFNDMNSRLLMLEKDS
jgi:hypothetical protein